MNIVFKVLFLSLFTLRCIGFDTLSDAVLYAEYKTNENLFNNLLKNKKPLWSIDMFKELLQSVLVSRQLKGYVSDLVFKYTPMPDSKFIVFGDIHSSFDSLIKDLKFLFERGIIDNNFRIKRPDTFFVFLGNIINGSENILETFTVILKLMQENLHLVFYLKGKSEVNYNWLNTGIKKELKIQVTQDKKSLFLENEIHSFFNTLPYALYLANNPNEGIIRFSNFDFNYRKIKEKNYIGILKSLKLHSLQTANISKFSTYNICNLNSNVYANNLIDVKVLIKNQDVLRNFQSIEGLSTFMSQKGAIVWSLFSSPNNFYQEYFNANYDAFCVVDIYSSLEESTISLYNRDIKDIYNFSQKRAYKLLTTEKIDSKDNLFFDSSTSKNHFDKKDIEELQNLIKNIMIKVKNISQRLYNFENRLNNFLFNSQVTSLPINNRENLNEIK